MKYMYWALPIATAFAYGVWRYFAGQVYVGLLPPFDLHLYSFEQAQAYLAGLTPAAKTIYLGPLHNADSVLMICLAATLIVAVWRRGWLWAVPALLYIGFDLAENRVVTSLLDSGMDGTRTAAVQLMILTGSKFGCLGLAAILALGVIWQDWRAARR